MGFGDEIIASGLARGAKDRGKRIAFGNGNKIIWSWQSKEIFKYNPNIAPPDSEKDNDIEWIAHYRGNRLYGYPKNGRWVFNDFDCPRGQIYFSAEEIRFGLRFLGEPIVVIEPRVKPVGACAGVNKQWPLERYSALASCLANRGFRVIQLVPNGAKKLLLGVEAVETSDFRFALSVLKYSALYIGPEGGLHHGSAAVGTKAVVIFGGFNSPKSTGYKFHENITVGEPCGTIAACRHCVEAMKSISVDRVLEAALRQLSDKRVAA